MTVPDQSPGGDAGNKHRCANSLFFGIGSYCSRGDIAELGTQGFQRLRK